MSILTTEQFVELMMKWGNFKARCKSDFPKSEEAKRNEELRDKYKGERCFIIGNGPSIKTQDLCPLADEIVFVTNGFYRYEKYYDVKPDYYCLMDPTYFNSKQGDLLLKGIDKIRNYEHKPVFVLPWNAKQVIRNYYKWDEWATVKYIEGAMSFTDGYSKAWDITKTVASPQCVVQMAMLLATYMGFKEIYLLGVEQTNIIDTIEAYYGKTATRYAYDNDDKKLAEAFVDSVNRNSLESQLNGYARIFHLYGEIYNYCIKLGINVYNCTPKTLVDSIPKKKYEELF